MNNSTPIASHHVTRATEHCSRYIDAFGEITVLGIEKLPRECMIDLRLTCSATPEGPPNNKKPSRAYRDAVRHGSKAGSGEASSSISDELNPLSIANLTQQLLAGDRQQLYVTGDGGSGKSEFSGSVAFKLAERFLLDPDAELLPLHVSVAQLGEMPVSDGDSFPDRVFRSSVWDWARHFADASRLCVIVDGLDELTSDRRGFFRGLREFIESHSTCRFVLTGRPGSLPPNLRGFGPSAEAQIAPLTDAQIQNYAARLFSHRGNWDLASRFVADLNRRDSAIRQLIRTPLMLALAVELYGDPVDSKDAGEAKAGSYSNAAQLIHQCLSRLFQRHRTVGVSPLQRPPEDASCFDALSTLAAFALTGPTPSLHFFRSDAVQWLTDESVTLRPYRGNPLSGGDASHELLCRLSPHSGVLGWVGPDRLSFGNRVLSEYLAA
jgi:hypothetical protein